MSARGAVYIANKIGPSTEPWGTQQRSFRLVECSFATLTNWVKRISRRTEVTRMTTVMR